MNEIQDSHEPAFRLTSSSESIHHYKVGPYSGIKILTKFLDFSESEEVIGLESLESKLVELGSQAVNFFSQGPVREEIEEVSNMYVPLEATIRAGSTWAGLLHREVRVNLATDATPDIWVLKAMGLFTVHAGRKSTLTRRRIDLVATFRDNH